MTTSNRPEVSDRKPFLVIGLAGTNGSGKDSTGHLLEQKAGFKFVSVTDILRHEASKRGLPLEREVLREISREWREARGGGVLVAETVVHYERHYRDAFPSGVVMASLRNHAEPDAVHQFGGLVLWIDADPKLRYDRIQRNAANRGELRAAEDHKTFEQFLAEENTEMFGYSDDPNALKTIDVKNKSDYILTNQIDTPGEAGLSELWRQIVATVPEIAALTSERTV